MNVTAREIKIHDESMRQVVSGLFGEDPRFYVAKAELREALDNPPLIEILHTQITVIDHDMTVHVI